MYTLRNFTAEFLIVTSLCSKVQVSFAYYITVSCLLSEGKLYVEEADIGALSKVETCVVVWKHTKHYRKVHW